MCDFTEAIAVAPDGSFYIADRSNARVRLVGTEGIITTFAGNGQFGYSGDGGQAALATFCYPVGLASDAAGNLYGSSAGDGTTTFGSVYEIMP
jgi:sugar lactone lactonase YvrE